SGPPLVPLRRAMSEVRAAAALAPARPAYMAGLRAALATVVPLAIDHAFQLGGGTWMSLAGFSGALADKGGPYRTRASTLATLTVVGGAAAGLGGAAGSSLLLAIPLTFIVALACSLGRAYGESGVSVGISVLNIYVISLAYPATSAADALSRSGFVLVGGIWAMLIALVLWPLRPYRPVRLAVAGAYRAVADYAEEVSAWLRTGVPPGPARVRTALETARAALATVRRGRPGESARGERLLVLGEIADQVFGHLFGLSDIVETLPNDGRERAVQETLATTTAAVARTQRAIASGIEAETGDALPSVTWRGDPVRAVLSAADDPIRVEARTQYEHAAHLLDRLAQYSGVAAATTAGLNAGHPLPALERPLEVEDPEIRVPMLAPLRAVLSRESVVLQFAVRVGLVTAAAVALTAALGLKRGYWVTITAVIILQPYAGATSRRALQRVLGTILGGALTAGLAALFQDPLAILGLAFVFSAVSVALLPLNYAAFSVFLTPTFVLLAEASAGDWHLAGVRISNTLVGGALAVLGSRFLWPSPESERTPAYLAACMRAMRHYLAEVVALFDDRGAAASHALRGARREVGLAILNADESLQRRLGEHGGRSEELAPMMTLATYARRLTASIAALALSRHSIEPSPHERLDAFARAIDATLEDLAAALEEGRAPEPMRELPDLDIAGASPLLRGRLARLERQVQTLHDAVVRWDGASEG
ncbi:MAG TPA: FUSC family protein, partial [Gemmatimonadales bacterium]|nr:FUSC family protein [Gemmatimonadales bacterium]